MSASSAGQLLRAVGALALLGSAVLPSVREAGGAPRSWLQLVHPGMGAAVMATALLVLSFPFVFGAVTLASAARPTRATGRAAAMAVVAAALLAGCQAVLAGLLLLVGRRGGLGFGLMVLAGAAGVLAVRGAIHRGEGDLGRTARAALLAGAAVVGLWFIVLYVDEHTPGALLGLGGALAVLAGSSLDRASD